MPDDLFVPGKSLVVRWIRHEAAGTQTPRRGFRMRIRGCWASVYKAACQYLVPLPQTVSGAPEVTNLPEIIPLAFVQPHRLDLLAHLHYPDFLDIDPLQPAEALAHWLRRSGRCQTSSHGLYSCADIFGLHFKNSWDSVQHFITALVRVSSLFSLKR